MLRKKELKIKGFSLMEVLIVLGILLILMLAGYLVVSRWFVTAGDVRKIADMNEIYKSLAIYYAGEGEFPEPSNKVVFRDNDGMLLGEQGVFDRELVKKGVGISRVPNDPQTGELYTYTKYANNKGFEIGGFLMDVEGKQLEKELNIIGKAYAGGEMSPYIVTYGNINFCEGKHPNPLSMYDSKTYKYINSKTMGVGSEIRFNSGKIMNIGERMLKVGGQELSVCSNVMPVSCVDGEIDLGGLSPAYPGMEGLFDNEDICLLDGWECPRPDDMCNKPNIYRFMDSVVITYMSGADTVIEMYDRKGRTLINRNVINNVDNVENVEHIKGEWFNFSFTFNGDYITKTVSYNESEGFDWEGGTSTNWGKGVGNVSSITNSDGKTATYTYTRDGRGYVRNGRINDNGTIDYEDEKEITPPEYECKMPKVIDVERKTYMAVYSKGDTTYIGAFNQEGDEIIEISSKELPLTGSDYHIEKFQEDVIAMVYKASAHMETYQLLEGDEIGEKLDHYTSKEKDVGKVFMYKVGSIYYAIIMGVTKEEREYTKVEITKVDKSTGEIELVKEYDNIPCVLKDVKRNGGRFSFVCETGIRDISIIPPADEKVMSKIRNLGGAACGDGVVQADKGEQCDDGDTNDTNDCSNSCKYNDLCGEDGCGNEGGSCGSKPNIANAIFAEGSPEGNFENRSFGHSVSDSACKWSCEVGYEKGSGNQCIAVEGNSWVGTTEEWDNPNNWSMGRVPGSGDYVIINGGANDPVLDLKYRNVVLKSMRIGGTTESKLIVKNGGLRSDRLIVEENMMIANGGVLTHEGNPGVTENTEEKNKLGVYVKGNLIVTEGGSIDVSGKGYGGDTTAGGSGYGQGGGISWNGSRRNDGAGGGGSYGGKGTTSRRRDSSYGPGNTYGSEIEPEDLGSGGGRGTSYHGGDGGGAIKLIVGGFLQVNGEIRSNGNNATGGRAGGGGGAGGSIWLDVGVLKGGGKISADGGKGDRGGAGGGGRIAAYYGVNNFKGKIHTNGGVGYGVAEGGTVYLEQLKINGKAELNVVGNTNFKLMRTYIDRINIQTVPSEYNAETSVSFMGAGDIGYMILDGAIVMNDGDLNIKEEFELKGSGRYVQPTKSGWIGGKGNMNVTNGLDNRWDIVKGDYRIPKFENVTILSGAKLSQTFNSSSHKYSLILESNSNITVEGSIDVSGRGYGGDTTAGGSGYGQGGGISWNGSRRNDGAGGGGSYGGKGTTSRRRDSSYGPGNTYGSEIEPEDLGSGGGRGTSYKGGDGGGAIKLVVGGVLQLNGEIKSNGNNATLGRGGGGGGAGGSIWLDVGEISGGGKIRADGGKGDRGGAGGGGRIAIYYNKNDYTGYINANGGVGYGVADGGTVYMKQKGEDGIGEIKVVGNSYYTFSGTYFNKIEVYKDTGIYNSDTNIGFNGEGTIKQLILSGSTIVNKGEITINEEFELKGSGNYIQPTVGGWIGGGGDLNITNGLDNRWDIVKDEYKIPKFENVSIANGVKLTQTFNDDSHKYSLILESNSNITVEGSIDVSGRGYGGDTTAGGSGYGQGGGISWNGSRRNDGAGGGGSYGGKGTTSRRRDSSYGPGNTYGSETEPVDLGSGGGRGTDYAGGNGGGAIKLVVGGFLQVNGEIRSNGNNATLGRGGGGGGAGGSIWLEVGEVKGGGKISADGGKGDRGGAGGGGRIAIYYGANNFSGTITVSGGVGYGTADDGSIHTALKS